MVRLDWYVTFSTRRLDPVVLRVVVTGGFGRLDAVPGCPAGIVVEPGVSSVRCDWTITDFDGSKTSSLCSPADMSHSAETAVRNLSAPSNGSRVPPILACRSCSTL